MSNLFHPLACIGLVAVLATTPTWAQLKNSATLSSLTLKQSSPAVNEQADFIVAVVNSEPITHREILNQTLRAEQRLVAQGAPIASRQLMMKEVLEKLINERIQAQMATDAGIKIDDATLNEAVTSIAAQNDMSVAQLLERIRRDGMSIEKFRSDLKDELLISKIRERDFEARIRIPDAEVEEYIRQQSNKGIDSADTEINLAQILIALPDAPDATTVQKQQQTAEQVRARLLNGEDFVKLAQQFSQALGKEQGSVMGLKNAGRYPEAFVNAVQNLGVGKISALIRTDAGFHILKVIDKQQAGLPPMVVEQTQVRHILIKTNAQTGETKAIDRLIQLKQRIASKTSSFEDAAKEFSQDGSASEGGNLGWVSPGQFVPEFESAMNQLPPGVVSAPVTTRFGVHLIEVMARRNHSISETEQREIVRGIIRDRKAQETFPQWVQELRSTAYIEYRQAPQQ